MIPFVDLKAQYHSIKNEIDEAVINLLESSHFVLGPEVEAFEKDFAAICGTKHGIGVNSGTSALHLALLAAGISPGDEVITVPFTFVATVSAIGYSGAKPVFVDIDPKTFTMDPNLVEAAISKRTKAILPVHLYGHPADMDPIMKIAGKHGIPVIEDCAQAHAAEYKGRRVGSIGAMGCFSFYPGKNLGAYGEGGLVVTDNSEYAKKISMLRDWGQEQKYHHVLKGYNYRLEGMQGAILKVKLHHLEAWTEARRSRAMLYNRELRGVSVKTPIEVENVRHVYHVYAIRTSQRSAIQKALNEKDIQTGIHYPIPVHLQAAWSELGHRRGDFPQSELAADETLSLPIYPELTDEQVKAVAAVICKAGV